MRPLFLPTSNPKSLPNGEQIGLGSVGVSAVFSDSLYVEPVDRRFGIRVWGAYPGIGVDDVVNVTGVMGTIDPSMERCIFGATVEDLNLERRVLPIWLPNRLLGGGPWFYNPGTGAGQPGIWRGAGLNNIGLLVKTTGVVNPSGTGYMMIDDGSGPLKCSLPSGVQVQSSWHYVCVVGISSCEPDTGGHVNRLLKVRSGDDILPLF